MVQEILRERNNTPKDYKETIISISNIVKNIETKFNKKFSVGIAILDQQ